MTGPFYATLTEYLEGALRALKADSSAAQALLFRFAVWRDDTGELLVLRRTDARPALEH